MKIKCEHPVIIFNHKLVYLLCTQCRHAVLGNRVLEYPAGRRYQYNFPWRDFYVAKSQVTPDTLDDFYLYDDDGVVYPVFMLVPCGKCALCKAKYCRDWQTRCLCETAVSNYAPLFITLTYSPECRPAFMKTCKLDFQLFMKRLRINVSRVFGVDKNSLRFFARSEYTPQNKYPHIHMLLWNMPYVSGKNSSNFQALNEFISNAWQNGFVKVEVCRDPTGKYAMKYTMKDAMVDFHDDEFHDDCWMLSSRRNGLGYDYAVKLLPTVLNSPDITDFTVSVRGRKYDKRSHKYSDTVTSHKCPIPLYFRRLWFPTLSQLMPQYISNAVKDFMFHAARLYYFMSRHFWHGSRSLDIVNMVTCVVEKYGDLYPIDFDCAYPSKSFINRCALYSDIQSAVGATIYDDERISWCYDRSFVHDKFMYVPDVFTKPANPFFSFAPARVVVREINPRSFDCYEFRLHLIRDFKSLLSDYRSLMNYTFDKQAVLDKISITHKHQDAVRCIFANTPDIDVQAAVDSVRSDVNWMTTHWINSGVC